jgi:hypothetical protein
MSARVLYRAAAVLLFLFALGHTLGFRDSDPTWGIGPVLAAMQATHFTIQGFTRTYWDFFVGAGLTVGVLYLFAAVLAWQLGGLPGATLALMRPTAWAFACCFAVVTAVSVRHLFWIPIIMSALITVCLSAAAWSSIKVAASPTVPKGSSHRGSA